MHWPDTDTPVDPALVPLIEAGQGESEGFELAERDLIRHATHPEDGSSTMILIDADPRAEEALEDVYGEADAEQHADA